MPPQIALFLFLVFTLCELKVFLNIFLVIWNYLKEYPFLVRDFFLIASTALFDNQISWPPGSYDLDCSSKWSQLFWANLGVLRSQMANYAHFETCGFRFLVRSPNHLFSYLFLRHLVKVPFSLMTLLSSAFTEVSFIWALFIPPWRARPNRLLRWLIYHYSDLYANISMKVH